MLGMEFYEEKSIIKQKTYQYFFKIEFGYSLIRNHFTLKETELILESNQTIIQLNL
jgi:hypothetical protein